MRESRVKRPSLRIAIRIGFSSSAHARATPCEIAPACPCTPPPKTFTQISYCFPTLATSKGRITCHFERRCPPKYSSTFLSLMTNWPVPGRSRTRAVAFLRRPVAHTGKARLAVVIDFRQARKPEVVGRYGDASHRGRFLDGPSCVGA